MVQTSGPEFITLLELADQLQLEGGFDSEEEESIAYRAITRSYAMVASHLGADQLQEIEVDYYHRISTPTNLLELKDMPLAALTNISSFKLNGEEYSTDFYLYTPWALELTEITLGRYAEVNMTYVGGWGIDSSGDSNLPTRIKEALLITAADTYTSPDNRMVGERIGDYQYTLAGGGPQLEGAEKFTIPANAQLLLRKYRKVRI